MSHAVTQFLEAHPHHHESIERWPVQGDLRMRLCLGLTLPPAEASSSILSIVLNEAGQVLFLHPQTPSGNVSHLLIGGRPEAGETPQQTAIREVGEETGWRIEPVRLIGFRHFFHLEPWVETSDRPYPHFIQPIYAARAIAFDEALILPADRIPAAFLDYAVTEAAIDAGQRPLLHAAASVVR